MGVEVLESELDRTEEPALVAALDAAVEAKDSAEVDRLIRALRPALLHAIFEDARSFVLHREESVDFSSRWQKWRTVFHLMWAADDYLGLVIYRLRCALQAKGIPILPRLLDFIDIGFFSIRIGDHVALKEGAYIPHGEIGIYGITVVGRRCVIAPWVGIGTRQGTVSGPRIGNNVFVGTGSKVLGHVYVGANAVIGANAVVTRDVPPHAIASGVPARNTMKGEDGLEHEEQA